MSAATVNPAKSAICRMKLRVEVTCFSVRFAVRSFAS